MAGSSSTVDLFMKVLKERHASLKASVKVLLEALVTENADQKNKTARTVVELTTKLQDLLPGSEVPRWLETLSYSVANYAGGQKSAAALLLELVDAYREMIAHKWVLDDTADSALDFDSIFELYRNESRLPELFDNIIEILEGIKDSGQVDSVSMIDALTKVILAIKKGKSGSCLAFNGAWSLLISFLNNYMWAELANIPVLGTAIEALKKTIEDAAKEMDHLHDSMQEEIVCRMKAEIKLVDKPDMLFLGYSSRGKVTSHSESSTEIGKA
jgi:hypothetical protein